MKSAIVGVWEINYAAGAVKHKSCSEKLKTCEEKLIKKETRAKKLIDIILDLKFHASTQAIELTAKEDSGKKKTYKVVCECHVVTIQKVPWAFSNID